MIQSPLTPLARAVLDEVSEAVVVFGADGRLLYMNEPGRALVRQLGSAEARDDLRDFLRRRGARVAPLRYGQAVVGEAVYVEGGRTPRNSAGVPDGPPGLPTLQERERQAILETLEATGWRLAEAARHLGISRTTLWRRLKAYGLSANGSPAPH